jgi:hypothetical protein
MATSLPRAGNAQTFGALRLGSGFDNRLLARVGFRRRSLEWNL